MASAVVSDNFETSTGAIPQLGGADVTTRLCSAWVNFNGTGTVAIRASYNVSSITDNGTGKYTVNFTTAMPDTNYTFSGAAGGTGGSNIVMYNQTPVAPTVSALAIMTANAYVSLNDMIYVSLAIFR